MHWRVQDLLVRFGPRALLLVTLLFAIWMVLISRAHGIRAYAEVVPVRIGSLESGSVARVAVQPGQVVERGDVIAVLDDAPVQGRLRVLQAEHARQVAATATVEDAARGDVAAAQLEVSRARVGLETAQAELSARRKELERRRRQVQEGIASTDELRSLEVEVAALEAEVPARERTLAMQQARVTQLGARLQRGADGGSEAPALLENTRSLAIIEEELKLLEERRRRMTLTAPATGRIAAVHFREGEILPAEAVFAELLPLATTTVVACLPEQYAGEVRAGSTALLYPQGNGGYRKGVVVDVVGLVAEAPDRCKQRPNEVGWVRPVRIEVQGDSLVPGQRFDVTFGALSDAVPAPSAVAAEATMPAEEDAAAPSQEGTGDR